MSLSPQEMKERSYLLLYGLLDEEEAEELRSLVATDSEAAIAFETARSTADILSEFVKIDQPSDSDVDAFVRNISVDINASTPFAFDPEVDSPDDGVLAKAFPAEVYSVESVAKDNNPGGKSTRRGKIKRKDNSSERASLTPLFRQGSSSTRNAWRDAFLHGFGTLFRGIDGGVVRLLTILWRSPVFVVLFSTILLLGIGVTVAALRCDHLLTRHFFDDFRVQIAVPRTLVRGVTQSIIVRTTGVDGRPRRVPIRLCFTDLATDEVLLNHTESGNSDGNLSYEIPNTADFPDEIRLSVLVGADESELFTTSLRIVDPDRRFAKFHTLDEQTRLSRGDEALIFVSPIYREILESFSGSNSRQDASLSFGESLDVEEDKTVPLKGTDSEPTFLRFFPESGRFISGYVNNVNVFCSDKDGRPLARRFSLFQANSDKPIATFDTSNRGFGCFQWIPPNDESFVVVALCSDSDKDNDERVLNPFSPGWEINDSLMTEQSLHSFPPVVEIDSSHSGSFGILYLEAKSEPAYFSLDSRIIAIDERLSGRLLVTTKVPLVITVEKYGVTVWEQFLTTSKDAETFDLALPKSLSGFLTVSLYCVSQRRFLKLAESSVFRGSMGASSFRYLAKLDETDSRSAGRLLIFDKVDSSTDDAMKSKTSLEQKRRARASVYWAANVQKALAMLELDDILMEMDEATKDEIVKTVSCSSLFNPPIIFDNLGSLAQSSRVKLESFKENEAKSFLWGVRFVFVVCISVVFASFFFTVFKAFSLGKSFLLCLTSIGLFLFTFELQNMLDAFIQSSQDVVFAIDEGNIQRANQQTTSPIDKSLDKELEASKSEKEDEEEQNVRLITTSELKDDVVKLRLDDLLLPNERSSGVLLVKLDDGDLHSVRFFSLETEKPQSE